MVMGVEPKRLEDLSDGDLIVRIKRRDDRALEILLNRYADDLYRFCCYLVSNSQDAQDIYQESLVRAMDRIDSLERGAAFRGWLFRIARNLSIDHFRRQRRMCTLPDEDLIRSRFCVEGPQEAVVVNEEHQTAMRALSQLAERQRTALVLREVEGLSYAAIGQQLNISHSAVETLLFRARRRLRDAYIRSEFFPQPR